MSAPLLCRAFWQALHLYRYLFLCFVFLPKPAHGAFINFDNCISTAIKDSHPLQLQFTPLFFDAVFYSNYTLSTIIYGNVSGQQVEGTYPSPNSSEWSNPNVTFGKIANVGSADKYSTLLADFKVLTYTAYDATGSEFCKSLVNGECPLGPNFYANASDPYELSGFEVTHDFGSAYHFTTLAGTIRVLSGDTDAPVLACISADITPDLGSGITSLITWLPAAVLILKGIATIAAAIWSPWGSTDIFRWSSNYGRDPDQLRLVTPGFGDCLQYIQFVTLTGALSLQYPGFYQPAVSQTAWSLLLFNQSLVSGGQGTQSLVDGIYKYNGTYGVTAMSELVGMSSTIDVWACMALWLLVIAVTVVVLCQVGFLSRWIYRTATHTTEEDLRQKNVPFTLGNMVRLMFNYFILPIVAISLFQLVIAGDSPKSVVVCAVVLLVIMIFSAGWILRVIFTTKPRTILFDDMPTVLLYGPLYNTYSDSAAPFALVPVFITFVRGVALGAVQPSGIAQIIVLAICEVILILTLNGFRPFQGQTSMNAYHTFFAIIRLITVLLSIAFVGSLGVGAAARGWIGYIILFLHACVLVFGFFLNAAQTLIEVIARSMGVAGDAQTGAIRGSILNLRMLKKRQDRIRRDNAVERGSMTSRSGILQDTDGRSAYAGGRSRSMSASSQQLLNQAGRTTGTGGSSVNRLSGFEDFSQGGDYVSSPSAELPDGQAGSMYLRTSGGQDGPKGAATGAKDVERAETYYRPPRQRARTNDLMTPGVKTRKSDMSGDFGHISPGPESPGQQVGGQGRQSSYDSGGLISPFGRDSPAPAYFRDRESGSNDNLPHTDYAVREVDQYYRGEALSGQPTRKLKTGPVDPEGPAAQAQSWFQRLPYVFGAKKKEKEKGSGFEVVRSSRMPKMVMQNPNAPKDSTAEEEVEMQTSPPMRQEPYRDSPDFSGQHLQATTGAERENGDRAVIPIDPEGERSVASAPGFDFGFTRARDVSSTRQSSVRQSLGLGGPAVGAPRAVHPGLRPEHPSIGERSLDGESQPRVSDVTRLTASDYDRPPPTDDGASSVYVPHGSGVPSLDPIEVVGGIDLPSRFNSRRSANLDQIDIGNTKGGQDWLKAVDELDWPAISRQSSSAAAASATNERGAPALPRRSSRRTPSADHTPGRGSQQGHLFEGFDSGRQTSSPSPDPEHQLNFLTAPGHDERPISHASVSHHRAADSISRNSFGASAAQHGTSAEIFGPTPPAEHYLNDER